MKKKVLGSSLLFLMLGAFTFNSVKANVEDKPKCKSDHTLAGFCVWSVEGTSECVTATQNFNCCHSGS